MDKVQLRQLERRHALSPHAGSVPVGIMPELQFIRLFRIRLDEVHTVRRASAVGVGHEVDGEISVLHHSHPGVEYLHRVIPILGIKVRHILRHLHHRFGEHAVYPVDIHGLVIVSTVRVTCNIIDKCPCLGLVWRCIHICRLEGGIVIQLHIESATVQRLDRHYRIRLHEGKAVIIAVVIIKTRLRRQCHCRQGDGKKYFPHIFHILLFSIPIIKPDK